MRLGAPIFEDRYRSDIDGLRAIAVTSVVLYHSGVVALSGGFVGVDIFFVISGYLIGAHIYRDVSARRFSLVEFYKKRAKRILPALFVLLLFCYVMALLVLTPLELASFASYALSTIFSFSNFIAWRDNSYFGPGADQKPLLMTWSLGVEEQFYIVIPLLMLLLRRISRGRPRSAIFWGMSTMALLSFVLSVWGAANYRHSTFYLLPSRAWELLAGVLMAIYETRPDGEAGPDGWSRRYGGSKWSEMRSVAGVAAILYAAVHYGAATPFPGAAAVPPVLGAALILSAPTAWLNRVVLSSKPFRWIGLVSYSWYLWHWPLLSFGRLSADSGIETKKAVAVCAIALGIAWVSYRFVEQPFRHAKMAAAPILRRYAAASLMLALFPAAMILRHGFPGRFPQAAAQERTLYRPHPCMAKASPVTTDDCLPTADGRTAVALIGDSHADGIAPRMRELAGTAGMRLYILAMAQCPPLIGMASSTLNPFERHQCLEFNQASLKLVAEDPAVRTVVLEALWAGPLEFAPKGNGYLREGQTAPLSAEESNANFKQGLDAMVSALTSAGKRVVVLKDQNGLRFDADRRLKGYMIPTRGWIRRRLEGATAETGQATKDEMFWMENEQAAEIIDEVAQERGAETFDLRVGLCPDSSCDFYSEGVPLYLDMNHLSPAGVAIALRGIALSESDDRSVLK